MKSSLEKPAAIITSITSYVTILELLIISGDEIISLLTVTEIYQ